MKNINYKQFFERDDALDKIYVTEDGHVFLPSAIDFMHVHCRKHKVSYKIVTRDEAFADEQVTRVTEADVQAQKPEVTETKEEPKPKEIKTEAESEKPKKVGRPKKNK